MNLVQALQLHFALQPALARGEAETLVALVRDFCRREHSTLDCRRTVFPRPTPMPNITFQTEVGAAVPGHELNQFCPSILGPMHEQLPRMESFPRESETNNNGPSVDQCFPCCTSVSLENVSTCSILLILA
jgi:hypothetical protein